MDKIVEILKKSPDLTCEACGNDRLSDYCQECYGTGFNEGLIEDTAKEILDSLWTPVSEGLPGAGLPNKKRKFLVQYEGHGFKKDPYFEIIRYSEADCAAIDPDEPCWMHVIRWQAIHPPEGVE